MAAEKEREYGLDLLRIVSMFFIVVLHVLGQGGVLRNIAPFSRGYYGAWLLEAGALCAVNCYGLISGYFGVAVKFQYRKYLPHWLQVFVYSMGIALLVTVVNSGHLGRLQLWEAATPVAHSEYWYFTAYTVVFFLMPYLNLIVEHIDEAAGKRLCLTLFLLFSLVPTLVFRDTFLLKFGYSPLWLIALYLIGGCIRKFGVKRLLPPLGCLGVYVLAVLCAWGGMLLWTGSALRDTGALPSGDPFLQYISPFIVLAGLALFFCFQQLKLRRRATVTAIRFLAPVSFGVYLIHTNPYIFNGPLRDCMVRFLTLPAPAYLAIALGTALGIYVICSLIDAVRLRIFTLVAAALFKWKE